MGMVVLGHRRREWINLRRIPSILERSSARCGRMCHPQPMGVVIDHTRHIRMKDVTVQNSGFWQMMPYYADDVLI
jgi:polygalacturonase